ncbi:hypothetical protein ACGFT2_29715 [Streptomyces sp. NPDC048514]|uniref:hypothetical protein n=1 Tax=Streptomyces sp. NPDC048514 TaxID=3365564 RepID=UPI003723423B
MRKRMLRSVLVAAFSAVVAFGTLNGLSNAKGDVRADSRWSVVAADSRWSVVAATDEPVVTDTVATPGDSIWS